MKILAKILFAVLFIISVIYLFNSQSFNLSEKTLSLQRISLRLPIPVADTAFSPYYLAVDKGIFAKYGFDVTLEPGTPELNPVKMVSQGMDDFGVLGGPELLFSGRNKGATITGIALLHKDSNFVVLLTLKEKEINELKDLQNKSVGFFYGHISTDILRMLFKKNNIKVNEVDVGFDYGSLITGSIDAQWAFRSTAGITLPAKGIEVNVISPADYGIRTNGHMIIVNDSLLKNNPGLVQRFTDALVEAINFALSNEDEAIAATIARDPNFSYDIGKKQLSIYNNAILRNKPIGWIHEEDMQIASKQMIEAGLISEYFDANSAFTNRFLKPLE